MNDKKRIIAVVALVGFMTAGIAAAVLREKNAPGKRQDPLPPAADGKGPVVVYYFHGHQRCAGCLRTEKMLQEVTAEAFAEEMKSGLVAFRAINVEDLANVDLVERFSVTARHPVIADEADGPGGPWKELSRVPGDKGALRQALEALVRPMLAKRHGGK
jgi:thiol-disulfide isomerase/thioredoxin